MANIDFRFDINDFTLEETISNNNVLNQGQTDSIEFRFYFGDYTSGSYVDALTTNSIIDFTCLLNIERPDGSSSNNVATTPISDAIPKYYKYVISNWVTEHDGQLIITPKRYNPVTNVTETYGAINLSVLASASQSSDTIEDAQYQALLSYLATTGANRTQVIADGAISKLDLVMFTGTVGGSGKITVAKADPTAIKENPEIIFGIALTDALDNESFYVQTEGVIEDVDTSGFTEGSILVPSATVAGGLIEVDNQNAPQAPNNRMPIAVAIYSHQNHGLLIVRPTFFPKMDQVQDVDVTGISNGQGLIYDQTLGKFKPGFSGGVFYDNNLPDRNNRFDGMTWFDQANTSIGSWTLPTIYWNVQVINNLVFNVYRSLVDSYGAYIGATKLEILDMGQNVLYQNTNVGLIDQASFTINDNLLNYGLQNYGMYLLRMTFNYYNQDDIVVSDTRLSQFQYII